MKVVPSCLDGLGHTWTSCSIFQLEPYSLPEESWTHTVSTRTLSRAGPWLWLPATTAPVAPPGQEGLVLLNGVQLIGGRVAPLAGQLPFGVLGAVAVRDVNVAAAEMPAALQVAAAGTVRCVHQGTNRGQQIRVLEWHRGSLPEGWELEEPTRVASAPGLSRQTPLSSGVPTYTLTPGP